jgi:small conductance mechanosensitive channel
VSGAVETMTLRMVALRDVHGVVHIVPNGQITKVSNLTRTWARVVLDVGVAYREDTDRVSEVMREVGRELWDDEDWRPLLVEPAEVPGIEKFDSGTVTIRMTAKTLPLKQWDVARELRRRLKRRFEQEDIEVPLGAQTLVWEGVEPPPPAAVGALGDGGRERGAGAAPKGSHSGSQVDDDTA